MEEQLYRQSRLCRLLGNPMAFAVVNVLGEKRAKPKWDREGRWPECVAGESRFGGIAFG
jgi:hypothetical protein